MHRFKSLKKSLIERMLLSRAEFTCDAFNAVTAFMFRRLLPYRPARVTNYRGCFWNLEVSPRRLLQKSVKWSCVQLSFSALIVTVVRCLSSIKRGQHSNSYTTTAGWPLINSFYIMFLEQMPQNIPSSWTFQISNASGLCYVKLLERHMMQLYVLSVLSGSMNHPLQMYQHATADTKLALSTTGAIWNVVLETNSTKKIDYIFLFMFPSITTIKISSNLKSDFLASRVCLKS